MRVIIKVAKNKNVRCLYSESTPKPTYLFNDHIKTSYHHTNSAIVTRDQIEGQRFPQVNIFIFKNKSHLPEEKEIRGIRKPSLVRKFRRGKIDLQGETENCGNE